MAVILKFDHGIMLHTVIL